MNKLRHPKGLYVLFFTEMWERFSFYTMFAVFVLYMTEPAHYARLKTLPCFDPHLMYAWYSSLIYITPLLGGWIADRYLGCRKTVYMGALLMAVGQFLLASMSILLFYPGLAFLIMGSGFFKPNISTMVGNLYEHDSPLRDSAFNIFYMGINIGAFIAPLVAGWLHESYGFRWAFFAAGFGMVISTVILINFNKYVAHADATSTGTDGFVSAREPKSQHEFKLRVGALCTIFGIIIFWWAVYMQYGDVMNLWARDYTQPVKAYGGIMPIEWYQSINPIFIIIFTPALVWLWAHLNRRRTEPSTSGKMQWGFVLSVASFLIMVAAAEFARSKTLVSPYWLVGFYGIQTLSELCLSPMGLSYVTKVAPPRYQSLMMGMWFAASGVGSFLAGYLSQMWITPGIQTHFPVHLQPTSYFWVMSGLSVACFAMMAFAFKLVNRAPEL